ncbi:hypothetical protein T10_11449 [Trichinella papuae]|uniref:Uncharacterized protein n=1 Tax=Trichinella papuae TaxID=268474 RepID=A0A0V1MWC0_9BILA|nr:hypothetical protein T10_11449 [Trichinella papuae]
MKLRMNITRKSVACGTLLWESFGALFETSVLFTEIEEFQKTLTMRMHSFILALVIAEHLEERLLKHHRNLGNSNQKKLKLLLQNKRLPGRESNPGRPRDRREYSPLYYRGCCKCFSFFYNVGVLFLDIIFSPAGNRTRVARVTGGNTHHYTTEDDDIRFCIYFKQILPKYTAIDFTNYEILNAVFNSIMNQVMNKMLLFEENVQNYENICKQQIVCTDAGKKPNHTCRCYNLLVHCNNYNVLDVWQGLNVDLKLTF